MVVSNFEYIVVQVHVRWYIQGSVGYIGHASSTNTSAGVLAAIYCHLTSLTADLCTTCRFVMIASVMPRMICLNNDVFYTPLHRYIS